MIKLDLHIHSCYSENLWGTKVFMPPSRSTPEDIIKTALKKDISVIAIADHDNIVGSLKAVKLAKKYKIVTLPCSEVSSKDGHIVAYNIQEKIPPKLSAEETIDLINEQGGYAVPAHPFNKAFSLSKKKVLELKKKIFALEVYNSHSLTNGQVLSFAKKEGFAVTAGSDAHHLSEIGNAHCSTNEKIDSADDLIKCIKKKKLTPHHVRNASILFEVAPYALSSFFYWKTKQIRKIFNSKIKMPYDEGV